MNVFRHSQGRLRLRAKMLAVCFLLIFVPLGFLTLALYNRVGDMLEEQMKRSASQSFQQAHSYITFKLSHMITISDAIYFSADVQNILVKYGSGVEFDIYDQTYDMHALDTFLNSFLDEDVYRATIYMPSNFMYSSQGVYIDNYEAFTNTPTYAAMLAARDKVVWSPAERLPNVHELSDPVDVVSLYRRVRNRSQINEVIGVIRLSIRQSSIDVIVSNADISQQGTVFLINQNGQIVSCSNKVNLERYMSEPPGGNTERDAQWTNIKTGAGQYLVMDMPINGTDWTMTCAIPLQELMSQRTGMLLMMTALAGSIGIAAYLIFYFMSRSNLSRMHALMEQMRNVYADGQSESEAAEPYSGRVHGELDHMKAAFNFMLRRIERLVEEKYQHGKEIKSAELRALQAQINPHFLYNTLDLINWKASEHGADEIMDIVQTLAQFYKLSLGRGSDIVALRYELDHIRAYVRIQNQRFDQGIELVIDVDDSFLEYRVPKIILQPLVENSILHGIMCKDSSPHGRVGISARKADGKLILSVTDDGVGMSESVARLVMSEQDNPGKRYGVYNIDRRLKLYYGMEFGLRFYFPAEGGIVAALNMPLVERAV